MENTRRNRKGTPAPCLSSAGTSSDGPREQVAGKRGVHSQTTHFCQTALGVNHLVLVSVFQTPPPARHSTLTAYGSERGLRYSVSRACASALARGCSSTMDGLC
ncbi:hypothetical protein SRHO_G00289490 [Serrasalmus rhombeus]